MKGLIGWNLIHSSVCFPLQNEKAKMKAGIKAQRWVGKLQRGSSAPVCTVCAVNCLYACNGNYQDSHCWKEKKTMKINKVVSRRRVRTSSSRRHNKHWCRKCELKFRGFELVQLARNVWFTSGKQQNYGVYLNIYIYIWKRRSSVQAKSHLRLSLNKKWKSWIWQCRRRVLYLVIRCY